MPRLRSRTLGADVASASSSPTSSRFLVDILVGLRVGLLVGDILALVTLLEGDPFLGELAGETLEVDDSRRH